VKCSQVAQTEFTQACVPIPLPAVQVRGGSFAEHEMDDSEFEVVFIGLNEL
jgi:hypothetical protein